MPKKPPPLYRWIRLAIVAVALYTAVTWLGPRLRERLAATPRSTGGGNVVAETCVVRSRAAVEDFRDKTALLSTPGIEVDWRGSMQLARRELERARRACACDFEACDTASEALEALAELQSSWEATLRAGGTPQGVDRRLQRIDRQLDEAWRQAGR